MARVAARPGDRRSGSRQPAAARRRRWVWPGLVGLLAVAALGGLLFVTAGRGGGAAVSTLRTADFHALAFSPIDPNVVYFGHHNGLMRSEDRGRTWQPLVQQRNFDAMGLAVGRGDGRQIYMAGHDVFLASADGGANWQPVANNLPGTDIHGFTINPDDPARLYAFVVGHGALTSDDGGRTWRRLPGQLPPDVMGMAASAGDPPTLYAASMRAGLLRSADGGQSWSATSGLGADAVLGVAVDPAARQTVYAGTEGGLAKTTDGGASWRKLPLPGQNVVAVAVSPANPRVVLAIAVNGRDGQVYRSEDGGATWGAGQ